MVTREFTLVHEGMWTDYGGNWWTAHILIWEVDPQLTMFSAPKHVKVARNAVESSNWRVCFGWGNLEIGKMEKY